MDVIAVLAQVGEGDHAPGVVMDAEVGVETEPATGLAIPVDDVPVRFELLRAGSRWAATAHLDGTLLTLTASDVEPRSIRLATADAGQIR